MNEWMARFPELAAIDDPAWLKAAASAQIKRVATGYVMFRSGDPCKGYVLVTRGSVRVQKMDAEGHEILLFRVGAGESCMLTTTCLLGHQDYPAEGVAETDTELVMIPSETFQAAMAQSEAFRAFVMRCVGRRISDLMTLVEDVAFGRMDVRIARRLALHKEPSTPFCVTHQEIAAELGTAREVVSRVLKDFERHGWLKLHRGKIEILDVEAIKETARLEE
ncbi:MAG TPA: Crp/Fnr family transcriptional regulator [Mariprofundaceae bacterium]|nr:Crp/Fnr family transcriptional regulator [Mariprofundaceae bacterium]